MLPLALPLPLCVAPRVPGRRAHIRRVLWAAVATAAGGLSDATRVRLPPCRLLPPWSRLLPPRDAAL